MASNAENVSIWWRHYVAAQPRQWRLEGNISNHKDMTLLAFQLLKVRGGCSWIALIKLKFWIPSLNRCSQKMILHSFLNYYRAKLPTYWSSQYKPKWSGEATLMFKSETVGSDQIPCRIFKELPGEFAPIFTALFRHSLDTPCPLFGHKYLFLPSIRRDHGVCQKTITGFPWHVYRASCSNTYSVSISGIIWTDMGYSPL